MDSPISDIEEEKETSVDLVPLDKDYQEYLEKAKTKEEEKKVDLQIPPDSHGNFGKGVEVYRDESGDWDAYMNKVDLKNGYYGDFVFYKLQVLHDTV